MASNLLTDTLQAALRDAPSHDVCVAYSGGPDSTALLHALASLPEARARGMRALHVDHGLHADSARWADACRDFCAKLGVPLHVAQVRVDDTHGEGPEAAARRARRNAYADMLREGEWLALAHHRDDQVETVLLKLLRGAGPEGLGGMHALRAFARGFLWRPLLDVPRADLRDYIADHGLTCIDDPANADLRFSRNRVRHALWPLIADHWPQAEASILHSATLCRTAADFIDHEADLALASVRHDAATLHADRWLALPTALRTPVLHQWLRERGLPVPADAQCDELQRQAARALEDAQPCIAWQGAEVRIWDGRLFASSPLPALPDDWQAPWDGTPLALPADCGALEVAPVNADATPLPGAVFNPTLNVRLRRGGERIRPANDVHTRELRDLFQQARVPPWVRARTPLIYAGDELIAVGDAWRSTAGEQCLGDRGVRLVWRRTR